ncbi:MAG: hypothetical protein A3D74_04495 [Candidatus Levybacteria bacterium RIFCSPHIGHO2_02_FULL_37_13]|nr:MAG: hypothetical protein A3D74_04495 [Candidatus Levybacteria bacterium RIFCSPHIGHO2_02_FULL_37_13]OGH30230.1 MAG: hypothetical protein A3E40_01970 [Candidatus Levybacteria bacterium RIFCSPHIGHO2_12_FULL_37_9]OGH37458.1 MAG: hypothetical protein A3B41_02565 [Candidatus Levybacteria bacterium RIFCSPLOWO2_01_FULL_37_26]
MLSFVLFLIVIALSSIFRLTNLGLIEFKIDEASNLFLSARVLFGHTLPSGGIATSTGILNPPLFNYLLLPFTLISVDPKFITFIIAFSNVLAIGFLFLMIKKYYNQTLSFIVSLLIAFSPSAIIFSRKIWPPDIVLPFAVVIFYSIHKIIIEKKIKFWIPLSAFLLYVIQLDLAYVFFAFILFLFLILSRPKVNIKYILFGLIIGIIPLAPYALYQLKNNCPDCPMVFSVGKKLAVQRSINLFTIPLKITGQGDLRFVMGDDLISLTNNSPLLNKLRNVFYVEYILTVLGIFIFWKKYPKLRFLSYAIFFVPISYFIFRLESSIHYFVILMPFLFFFIGISIYTLLNSKNLMLKYLSLIIFSLIIITSTIINFGFFDLLNKNQGFRGDYGQSLSKTYPLAEKEFENYKQRYDYNEILISSYIPNSVMHGSSSFAQMLYPISETKINLEYIEDNLKKFPNDPRITHGLIVFYTLNPTRETLDVLRNKLTDIPAYQPIYNEVKLLYLQRSYKKIYQDLAVPFTFEYPEHWTLIERREIDLIEVSDENYIFSIQRVSGDQAVALDNFNPKNNEVNIIKIFDNEIKKKNCFVNKKYCGTIYEASQIDGFYYLIEYRIKHGYQELKDNNNPLKVMDDIVDSLRNNEKYKKRI